MVKSNCIVSHQLQNGNNSYNGNNGYNGSDNGSKMHI